MILLTGGTGLLGSHLLYKLVRERAEVVALKRPSSDLEEVRRVFLFLLSGRLCGSQAAGKSPSL